MKKYLLTTEGDMQDHPQGQWCRLDDVLTAVEAEPEYPGEAPTVLCSVLNKAIEEKDLDLLLHAMRQTVRLTKQCITERIKSV